HGNTADVALGIGCAAFARDGRESREDRCLLADLGEDFGAGVLGDVLGNGEGPIRAGTLGMHAALGNDFTVEMRELFDQPDILQQDGTSWSGCHGVLIVDDWRASGSSELFHAESFLYVARRGMARIASFFSSTGRQALEPV